MNSTLVYSYDYMQAGDQYHLNAFLGQNLRFTCTEKWAIASALIVYRVNIHTLRLFLQLGEKYKLTVKQCHISCLIINIRNCPYTTLQETQRQKWDLQNHLHYLTETHKI